MSDTNLKKEDKSVYQATCSGSSSVQNDADTEPKESISDSVVEYLGSRLGYCGYCKLDRNVPENYGRRGHDMIAFSLKAEDYQSLLDRGWRRSGTYCYHPINDRTCCPNYPISCKALKFEPSASQRRCIENLNSFLVYGGNRKLNLNYSFDSQSFVSDNLYYKSHKSFEDLRSSGKARDRRFVKSCERKVKLYNLKIEEAIKRTRTRNHHRLPRIAPLENYLYPTVTTLSTPETIQVKHHLQIKLHHIDSQESVRLREEENKLIQLYQEKVHKESRNDWTMSRYCEFLVETPLQPEPILDRDYLEDCDKDTHVSNLYSRRSDYLIVKPPELPSYFGTYHCSYLLDGKLIAVGVLDILPKCVTTVYFFYDPQYAHLNLGIYSALVEISMVRQISSHFVGHKSQDNLVHYHMGYYVHECKKMHYKTKFKPSYLLCYETFEYVQTELCLQKLKDKKYSRFSLNPYNDFHYLKQKFTLQDIGKIPMLCPVPGVTSMLKYLEWLAEKVGQNYVKILVNNYLYLYCQLAGPALLKRIILNLNSVHNEIMLKHGC